jgi:hypothetical protein
MAFLLKYEMFFYIFPYKVNKVDIRWGSAFNSGIDADKRYCVPNYTA